MMKWGSRRKSSSSASASASASSFKPSLISYVSPLSWLSKFKKMKVNSEQKGRKQNSPTSVSSPPQCKNCGNGGRFYGGDDEAFWRLSFGEESNDILDDGGRWNVKKHERKMERKSPNDMKISNRTKELENLRRRFEMKSKRIFQEQVLRLEREAGHGIGSSIPIEKDHVLQFETPRTIWTPRRHSFTHSVDFKNSRQKLQQSEDLDAKIEKRRGSVHVSREIQRRKPKQSFSKVRVNSPRMMVSKVEICKIKAVEDMRKAKQKMKKAKEKMVEESIEGLDSFAVVKCSLDPQKDFRDSMVEMIREKQIKKPEEMEELLACYLTLNSDEYHDLIIKVFKQVWFEMNLDNSLGVKLEKQCCYYD